MAAPPLADPPLPEPAPGGTRASSASPAAGSIASAAQKKPGDDELEHGWTGLGLPAYEEEKPGPPPQAAAAAAPAAGASAPAPPRADVVVAPIVDVTAPARVTTLPFPGTVAPAAKEPAPVAKEPAPVAKEPAPPAPIPVKAAATAMRAHPPRPSGKSGAFAAVRPTPSPPATAPPRPAAPAPAAPPAMTAPPDTERNAQPAPSESNETTLEDDLGATIPDPRAYDDLTATVPMLPHAAVAPRFGLPPPEPAPPLPAAAPSFGLPPPAAAPSPPVFGLPSDARPSVPHDARPSVPHDARPSVPHDAPPAAAPALSDAAAPLPPEPDTGPPPYGPGAIIGDKYRLIRVIGRGGMGAVWLAHNTALDVEVAIKLMRRDRATPEAAARFTTEARAAARLGHSSIVRVFDFGETSRGDPFIVMELLQGESFGALLARKKKLKPLVAVQTLLPVAHALAAAHAKGIVHRDLKPDNILLAKDESNVVTPKVVDFGIAKLVSADVDRHFTIAGEILGSPDYMSPEQARGEEDIDHRTDIWTFTVLLYEAITGKRPFDGSNYNALLASIIATRPAPITDLGIPEPALSAILEKGLAKERDARWQSVREMGMELAAWALERGAEHDLAGASLAAQWIEPRRRRLFTVAGVAPLPDPAAPPEPAIPPPPPLGALAADLPKPEAPAIAHTMPPFVPRRRPWIAVVIGVVCLGLLAFGLLAGDVFRGQPEPAASVAAPTATATASAAPTASEQPTTTASAPSTTTTAKPATSAKRPAAPPKPKAPRVKDDIHF